jgi:LPS-assembly protein
VRPAFRLLPLPFCIACALAAHSTAAQAQDREPDWGLCPVEDSVPAFPDAQAPVGSPEAREQQPTDISGDSLAGVDGENVQYSGNVTLRRGDQFLGAEKLTYDNQTSTYTAEGSVRYQDSGMRLMAEHLEGDQNADTHRVDNVRYQLTERRGNGGADRVEMKGSQGSLYGSTYSTCPPSQRWWELRAGRIDIDNDKGEGIARNATLRVGKVPILYVPIFAFPTDNRRRTGLLYPVIGLSGRNGFDWRQPIYFNLAPNYDLTLEPRLMTQRGLMLGTEFRYLTPRGAGTFDVELFPSDDLTIDEREEEANSIPPIPEDNRRKEDRGMFRFNGRQNLSSLWQARANLAWISDPRYIEDMSNSLNGISTTSIQSTVGVYGRGRTWDAGATANYWQLSDYLLTDFNLPYNRLPRLYGRWEDTFGRWFTAGFDGDLTHFSHTDSSVFLNDSGGIPDGTSRRGGGTRIDLKPFVSMPLEGASWFVKPTFAWRYTGYQVDDDLATVVANRNGLSEPNTSPSRSQPITSLDAGLFFDRQTTFRGDSYLHTLEPRLYYLNSPYRNQDDLPLFDTQPLTFSYGQLFRDNRYTGADRQTDANQLTLALTTRLISDSDGREKLSASIGQIRYFDDSRVALSNEIPIQQGKSAWIADTNYAINDRWTIGATYQYNPTFRNEDLASVRTRYLIGDEGIVNLSYRYRRDATTRDDLLKQVDFSFLYPISPSWSIVGRYYYSLLDKPNPNPSLNAEPGLLEGIIGVQWDSCCLAARLVARRYVRNRLGEMNDAIQLEIELKGLGSAGPETASRLRRAILGYYREDLYLVPPPEVDSGVDDDDLSPEILP